MNNQETNRGGMTAAVDERTRFELVGAPVFETNSDPFLTHAIDIRNALGIFLVDALRTVASFAIF